MKEKTLHMIGNAHIDPVWLWQWPEGFHEIRATFRSALDRMKEYEEFVFVSSSAAFYAWIEDCDPDMFVEIQQRVKEGRWQIVGGWWIQPDCNLPCGESFVRQGLYGQRYFQEKFGVMASVGYNVDSFGHSAMLPQILKKSGLKYYVFLRPQPHEKGLPGRLFWWEADDGSHVLAFRIPFEYCSWGEDLEDHVQRCAAEVKRPFDSTLCFYGVGNHGGGPTRENIDSIRRMQNDAHFPILLFSTPQRLFDDVISRSLPIPVVHDELQHHASGCYAAHSEIKLRNRRAENLLLTAEKFSAIAAWTIGLAYPANLTQAWKNVLFNQFHDILAGTSLESAYQDARDMYGEANSIANRTLNLAIQSLAWKVNIPQEEGMTPLVIFNPHAWESRVPVELEARQLDDGEILLDDTGRQVPVQVIQSQASAKGRNRLSLIAELPALGYRTFRFVKALKPLDLHGQGSISESGMLLAGDDFLENNRFRLEFDQMSGTIRQLYDKQAGTAVFCGPAALPVVYDDPSDTWSHNVFKYDQVAGCFEVKKMHMVENGAVKAVLRIQSQYGDSHLIQDFELYRNLNQIDVRVTVDWREHFKAFKLRFPLNLSHMKATSQIPYGHIERLANGQEEPGQGWIDVSGISRANGTPYGLSILNDCKYSYDVNIREVGLTILRSPIYAHHMPVMPDPEREYRFMDQGYQHFRYTLLPHSGSWEAAGVEQRTAELNQPPICIFETYHPDGNLPTSASFLSVNQANVIASVLKQSEDNTDLILRCVETQREATLVTICLPFWQRVFEAQFSPCEIKTFQIPKDLSLPVIETNLLEWRE